MACIDSVFEVKTITLKSKDLLSKIFQTHPPNPLKSSLVSARSAYPL